MYKNTNSYRISYLCREFFIMLKDFKPVLTILLRFLGIYIVLVLLYQWYLNQYAGLGLDPISRKIAGQIGFVQNACGYPTQLVPAPNNDAIWFRITEVWTSLMVEGCNAISVMILFLAFIFAFYKGYQTFIFAFVGLILLHIMNILRIVLINIVILKMPENYTKIAHDYLFPAIIYGSVVLLWIVWIKFFVFKNEEKHR